MSTCPKKTKNLCMVQLMVKEENKLIIQFFFLFQYSHQIIFIYLSSTITNNLIFFLFIFIYNLPSILLIYQISLKNEFLPSYNHSLSLL
jgi:hypothetical protein